MNRCKSCGAEIIWATTKAGRKIPLDPEPVKVPLFVFDNGYANDPPPLRQTHFASCPNAKEHRQRD